MRKVLSFVLVLTLVLSSFSMAFAAETKTALSDIAGNANAEAITVDFNLGIIDGMGDGTFAPDQAVTRAQFAAMMTRALAIPESALAGYTATSFKDTTGYGWAVPYLAFCQSKGILVGDGAGNVMPGKTVSVNEAMTMVMRAIGYTNNSAALVGVWPANYVSLAQNNKLYDKVATATGVTRANAAQIIYNALTVDKVEVAADGTTKVLSDRSNADDSKWKIVNMLTTGLDAYADTFVINGDEASLINLKPYIGKQCTVYIEKAKTARILAVASEETTAIPGSFKDDVYLIRNATTDAITFNNLATFEGDDDVDYTIKNSADPEIYAYMVNGKAATVATNGTTKLASDASITINGDTSGKYITNVWTVTAWVEDNAKKVNQADLNQIKDDSLLTYDFETLKDGSIDKNNFELVGVKSLDDIKVDNIVYVYAEGRTGKIVKVAVGTEVVEGKVTAVKDNNKKFVVNGKTYEAAGTLNSKAVTFKAGDTVKLYLDANGDIFTYDVTSGKTDKYAVRQYTDTVRNQVKLYTADDESKWFDYDSDDVPAAALTTNAATDAFGFNLVSYSVDKNGKIDNATTGSITAATAASFSAGVLTADGGSYRVSDDCVVFGVTTGAVKTATKIGNLETATPLGNVAFVTDDNVIVALIVDNTFASKTDTDSYAVISAIDSVENADGDSVQEVFGLMDGAALDKLTTGSSTAQLVNVDAVGLFKVEFDADGAVKKISVPVDAAGLTSNATGLEVKDVDGNKLQLTGSAVWNAVNKDAKVYRAVMKDGKVDSYKLSDISAINKGHFAWLYNTVKEDDKAGYDVVIYVTDYDL